MKQTYSKILLHMVFHTKDDRPWLTPAVQRRLYPYLAGIVNRSLGHTLIVGGVTDHIHILYDMRPAVAPAEVARVLKSESSSWMHESFPEAHDFAWQGGYGVFSVSESVRPTVTNYIQHQEEHHRTTTYHEEFLLFLERAGLTYDGPLEDDEPGAPLRGAEPSISP